MKINLEVEIDTKEDRDELEELIEKLQNLSELINGPYYKEDDE